jgi:hypothetical protein
LFGEDESKNANLKEQYIDILHKQCSSIFQEELLMLHQKHKAKQEPCFNTKYF